MRDLQERIHENYYEILTLLEEYRDKLGKIVEPLCQLYGNSIKFSNASQDECNKIIKKLMFTLKDKGRLTDLVENEFLILNDLPFPNSKERTNDR